MAAANIVFAKSSGWKEIDKLIVTRQKGEPSDERAVTVKLSGDDAWYAVVVNESDDFDNFTLSMLELAFSQQRKINIYYDHNEGKKIGLPDHWISPDGGWFVRMVVFDKDK